MNPLRAFARRTRAFLSEPAREIAEREAATAAEASTRIDEILETVRALRSGAEADGAENRSFYLSLRTLVEEQASAIAELKGEVQELRSTSTTSSTAP